MHLVQILLPLFDGTGQPFARADYERVAGEMTERFGGVTAYTRAPAEGRWRDGGDGTARDEILVHEVMTETLDCEWWRDYRGRLEERFDQDRIVVRAHEIEVL
jgi:hypothetical protein